QRPVGPDLRDPTISPPVSTRSRPPSKSGVEPSEVLVDGRLWTASTATGVAAASGVGVDVANGATNAGVGVAAGGVAVGSGDGTGVAVGIGDGTGVAVGAGLAVARSRASNGVTRSGVVVVVSVGV